MSPNRNAALVEPRHRRDDDELLDELHAEYAATGAADIRARLIERYMPFAYRTASRFRDRGEPLEDLRQVAMCALVRALDRFEPSRGIRFTTYAGRCIAGELKRYFRDHSWAVRVGRSAQERYLELRAAVETLHQELGRSPTVPEVAARLRMSDEDVLEAMEIGDVRHATSLDAPAPSIGRTSDRLHPGTDELGADDPGFEEVEQGVLHRQVIGDLLHRLGDTDRRLIQLYYLEERTQVEVARIMGASQVSVSRHLSRIVARLRAMAAASARPARPITSER